MKLTDWCIVTVLDYSAVSDFAEYILGNDVYEVMVKVVLVIALLFLLIIYYSGRIGRESRNSMRN